MLETLRYLDNIRKRFTFNENILEMSKTAFFNLAKLLFGIHFFIVFKFENCD